MGVERHNEKTDGQEALFRVFISYLSHNTDDIYLLLDPEEERIEYVGPNADRVLGCVAEVTEEICNVPGSGRVKALGNSWAARSLDGGTIPAGEKVLVQGIEGVKLLVTRAPEN